LELTRAANTGGSAAFRTQLRTALRSPYLTESDFIEMALMCAGLSLEQHSLAVLEVALDRYPSNGSLLTRLASAYLSSANRDLRSKGRIMLEGYLGIELENGEPVIRGSRVDRIKQAIGRLCDVYSQMDKPEWVYSMTSSAEKLVADPVVMRNKAHALGKLGRREESEAQFQKAIARFPEDDTVHAWYANFLESEGRFEDAYAQEEEALRLDPASGRRWLNIALSILSYGNCRIRNVIVKGLTLSREQRRKYAVPILARAVELNPSLRAEVVSTLVKVGALGEANAFSEGSELTEGYDTEVIDGIEQLLSTSRSIGVLASKPREEPERSGVLETVSDDTYSNANSHDTLTGAVDR
jgi:tetratricopeptide (TPR) repeat protein